MTATNQTILTGVVGSRAHGLAGPDSDTDRLSVFLAPSQQFWFMENQPRETIVDTNPDHTWHELGKYCRILLKGGPVAIELLFLDDELYETRTRIGQELIDLRDSFLSQRTITSLGHVVEGHLRLYPERVASAKRRRHAARHVLQLEQLVGEGTIRPTLSSDERSFVQVATPAKIHDRLSEAISRRSSAPLPDEPDHALIQDWLLAKRALNFCS